MTGHCIVCGMGDVGYRVVELLHRLGEEVVVVTLQAREERRRTAESLGIRVVMGDARVNQNLDEAGLASAGCSSRPPIRTWSTSRPPWTPGASGRTCRW